MTAYRKKWLKDNPGKRKEYEDRYRAKNRDKVRARVRKWRQKN
jgi:hypothetical protein